MIFPLRSGNCRSTLRYLQLRERFATSSASVAATLARKRITCCWQRSAAGSDYDSPAGTGLAAYQDPLAPLTRAGHSDDDGDDEPREGDDDRAPTQIRLVGSRKRTTR